jgi:hypothetical protein
MAAIAVVLSPVGRCRAALGEFGGGGSGAAARLSGGVRRDRPGALRLQARWGVRHLELAAVGVLAIIFALVAAVAIAVAGWLRWFR